MWSIVNQLLNSRLERNAVRSVRYISEIVWLISVHANAVDIANIDRNQIKYGTYVCAIWYTFSIQCRAICSWYFERNQTKNMENWYVLRIWSQCYRQRTGRVCGISMYSKYNILSAAIFFPHAFCYTRKENIAIIIVTYFIFGINKYILRSRAKCIYFTLYILLLRLYITHSLAHTHTHTEWIAGVSVLALFLWRFNVLWTRWRVYTRCAVFCNCNLFCTCVCAAYWYVCKYKIARLAIQNGLCLLV